MTTESKPARLAVSVAASIVALLLLLAICLGALWLGMRMGRGREEARRQTCLSNIKSISLRQLAYAQDYGDRTVPADRWCDRSLDYITNVQILRCPSGGAPCAYDLNRAMGGQRLGSVATPTSVPFVFEGSGGWNGVGGQDTVAYRHLDCACFGFVDGHAAWLTPGEVARLSWTPGPIAPP